MHSISITKLADFRNTLISKKLRTLPSFIAVCGLIATGNLYADDFFNPALLSGDTSSVADLSRFDKGEGQPAGNYRVEVYLNENYIGTQDLYFDIKKQQAGVASLDNTGLIPCISVDWLANNNVNIDVIPALATLDKTQCVDLPLSISQASTRFDFDRQILFISIPQAMLVNNVRGYISPEYWNEGIPAAMLNYRFTGSNSRNSDTDIRHNNYFLNLDSGINLGLWRFRNESTWAHNQSGDHSHSRWRSIRTYAQRAITSIKSELTIGDSNTDNEIFDSIGFRGARLSSDDNMLPDSLKGFAPTIRGIANTNAQVTVEQNGYVIYQTYVPPGAFEIKDLYATSNSGNLKVTVKENNGTTSQFTVPYSEVPILQREGRVKYALTAGEFRSGSPMQEKPKFAQGTLLLGLPKGFTFYEGMQLSENYQSFALGIGKNLGEIGAISADITHANSTLPDGSRKEGQSLRFLYAKSLNQLGTNFQLLGYRYSTKGFYTLSETAYQQMKGYRLQTQDGPIDVEPEIIDYHNLYYSKKGRFQVNISQQLGNVGSMYLMGSHQTYWNTGETEQLWQVGYNGNWQDISYNLNGSINKNIGVEKKDKQVALSVSIPLNSWLMWGGKAKDITNSSNMAYATYSASYDSDSRVTQQAGLSGTLLEDNNLSYSIHQGYTNKGEDASGNLALDYRGTYGNSNIGYGYGKHWQQVNYGTSGGITLHEDGVTLSQPLSDTNILIKATGAEAVRIENATGVKTDWRGYAIVPYATAYRNNRVALNTTTLNDNADIENAVVNVVPIKGALVKTEFTTYIGDKAMITLKQRSGKPIPFGAIVKSGATASGGIVGDNGQVFLSGLTATGQLNVIWGNGIDQQCIVDYQLPTEEKMIKRITASCS
ncbi:fimbrial biogenesis usher protein [Proteus mirabilis]|nr:fimbrial biogenesis usher protein [Proteus mirabilis]MBG6049834.1 fimbrial biogenesis usher protein [Proteus mirabilis]